MPYQNQKTLLNLIIVQSNIYATILPICLHKIYKNIIL